MTTLPPPPGRDEKSYHATSSAVSGFCMTFPTMLLLDIGASTSIEEIRMRGQPGTRFLTTGAAVAAGVAVGVGVTVAGVATTSAGVSQSGAWMMAAISSTLGRSGFKKRQY